MNVSKENLYIDKEELKEHIVTNFVVHTSTDSAL